ncbi:MAG: crossover junction endodeoxyribonuclease RuvC [Nitrospirae bacterium]|nr:MAG: crossover junction endodeoxyribonuclease RuvC [Nitrospirota bacterium]
MKILGIDPGSIYCGYGLINVSANPYSKKILYLSSGRIVMPAKDPLHERLKTLFSTLSEVFSEYKPDEIAIEKMFFAKGTKAAISMGHTRGAVLVAAALTGMPIFEYSALEVKKAVVGYGKADKNQVQCMVSQILNIRHKLSPDSADAIALAVCHAHTRR